jgi:hypothetical protein
MSDILVQRFPVHADFIAGGEVSSPGIAFEDYTRMQQQFHALNLGRRYKIPAWALDDDQMRAVITRYMEVRADYRYAMGTGTDTERLERAQQRLKEKRPELVARIDRLCALLVAAKRDGLLARAAELGQKVEETDTQLVVNEDIHKLIAGVIYFYWRCGYTSVETGKELGLKPPHVRGLLTRLLNVAAKLGFTPPEVVTTSRRAQRAADDIAAREARAQRHSADREGIATRCAAMRNTKRELLEAQVAKAVEMRKAGRFTVDIARELGLGVDGCAVVTRWLVQAGLL